MWTMQSQPQNISVNRAVQNGPLDELGSLVQRRRRANIEDDRRVAFAEQAGHEGLPEISRSSGQQHLHGLIPIRLSELSLRNPSHLESMKPPAS